MVTEKMIEAAAKQLCYAEPDAPSWDNAADHQRDWFRSTARAALLAAEAAAWEPMETAPRDGTWVLIRVEGWRDPVIASWRTWRNDNASPEWLPANAIVPLHAPALLAWSPLPVPPETSDE